MVRLARAADAAAIAEVQVASWQAAYRGLVPASRLAAFTVPARTAAWRRSLADPGRDARTAVFEDAGDVLGFATSGPSRDLRGWGEIWALYVAPTAWGRGVGSALFADAIHALARRDLPRVMLWVLDGNARAIAFYEGNGLSLDGARDVDDGYPIVRMRRP